MLDEGDIHILAISVLDTSDSAVIELVAELPNLARLLKSRSISFAEGNVAIEVEQKIRCKKLQNHF